MSLAVNVFEQLSGAAKDTMNALFIRGPLWDGDVPSKSGRDELLKLGIIFRTEGWQSLTEWGVTVAIEAPVKGWADQRWYRKQRNLPLD